MLTLMDCERCVAGPVSVEVRDNTGEIMKQEQLAYNLNEMVKRGSAPFNLEHQTRTIGHWEEFALGSKRTKTGEIKPAVWGRAYIDDTDLGNWVVGEINKGNIDGFSIRGEGTTTYEMIEGEMTPILHNDETYEVSLVSTPAVDEARITMISPEISQQQIKSLCPFACKTHKKCSENVKGLNNKTDINAIMSEKDNENKDNTQTDQTKMDDKDKEHEKNENGNGNGSESKEEKEQEKEGENGDKKDEKDEQEKAYAAKLSELQATLKSALESQNMVEMVKTQMDIQKLESQMQIDKLSAQIKSMQAEKKSDSTKNDQTKSDQTKNDQTKNDQTKNDQIKNEQIANGGGAPNWNFPVGYGAGKRGIEEFIKSAGCTPHPQLKKFREMIKANPKNGYNMWAGEMIDYYDPMVQDMNVNWRKNAPLRGRMA